MATSVSIGEADESPRSTVIPVIGSIGLDSDGVRMTQSGGGPEDGSSDLKASASGEGETNGTKDHGGNKTSPDANQGTDRNDKAIMEGGLSPTPHMQANSYLQGYPAHLTPQPGQGYYPLGYQQSQVTPEPPSPAGPGATAVYDVGSFFQQPAAFHNSPFVPQTPLSPRRTAAMAGIPPASPLFPRVSTTAGADVSVIVVLIDAVYFRVCK